MEKLDKEKNTDTYKYVTIIYGKQLNYNNLNYSRIQKNQQQHNCWLVKMDVEWPNALVQLKVALKDLKK